MKLLFLISKDYVDLAKAEINSLFECDLEEIYNNLLIGDVDKNLEEVLTLSKRLGLTKSVYLFLQEFEENVLSELNNSLILNTYKISVERYSDDAPLSKILADEIYSKLIKPIVSMTDYEHHYVFFLGNKKLFGEEIYVNKEQFDERRSHKQIYNHPTSMHPRIARAMINLGAKKEFIDPFCGVCGIVLEGALMGLNVRGSDISKELIGKAKDNLTEYNINIELEVKDALTIKGKYECIISDLPYGKNSLVSTEINSLYKKFLNLVQKSTQKMVLGMLNTVNLESLVENTLWVIKDYFDIYVHKSMTRRIVVLEKKNI